VPDELVIGGSHIVEMIFVKSRPDRMIVAAVRLRIQRCTSDSSRGFSVTSLIDRSQSLTCIWANRAAFQILLMKKR
jgi:hypothetical protein